MPVVCAWPQVPKLNSLSNTTTQLLHQPVARLLGPYFSMITTPILQTCKQSHRELAGPRPCSGLAVEAQVSCDSIQCSARSSLLPPVELWGPSTQTWANHLRDATTRLSVMYSLCMAGACFANRILLVHRVAGSCHVLIQRTSNPQGS